MHGPGKAAGVPFAFLFILAVFYCAGLLSQTKAQSMADTKWISTQKIIDGWDVITFSSDGQYLEKLNKVYTPGRWQASTDNQQITVTFADNKVLHFTRTDDGKLLRDTDQMIFKPTTFEAATASSAVAPDSSPPAPDHSLPTVKLTEDQASAVVLIKGDTAEGTGFLVKMPGGPVVVTNIHVISNNPNLKITTNTGALISIISYKGATDRDLAMIAIKDGGFKYLDLATDVSGTVQPGDEVITPGNSEGGEVMLNTDGKVLGIGPDRVEFDNPIYHGNSGGPVFHVKTGKVIGIVTEALKAELDQINNNASRESAMPRTNN